ILPGPLTPRSPERSPAGEVQGTPPASRPPRIERREEMPTPYRPPAQATQPLPDTPTPDSAAERDISLRRHSVERLAGAMQERAAPMPLHPRREAGEAPAMASSSSPHQPQQESSRLGSGAPPTQEGDGVVL